MMTAALVEMAQQPIMTAALVILAAPIMTAAPVDMVHQPVMTAALVTLAAITGQLSVQNRGE